MSKQTMRVKATTNFAPTTHHEAPSVPVKSALEIAMAKAGLLVDRDKPAEIDSSLVDMYNHLEQQMLLLKAAIHMDKIKKGIVTVDTTSPFNTVTPEPKPEFVIPPKSKYYLDADLIIGRCLDRAKKTHTTAVKAESVPVDDFECATERERVSKLPTYRKTTTTVKAATVRDDHKAGKESFRDTFRDAVVEAFGHVKPGMVVKAHTVNSEDPTSTKYRVFFNLHHLGSSVLLERLSKRESKQFTVEIPLKNGKLNPESIPAFAYELK